MALTVEQELEAIRNEVRTPQDYQRKADQHWEMAGCARQDNDQADADRHTKLAREYQRMAANS